MNASQFNLIGHYRLTFNGPSTFRTFIIGSHRIGGESKGFLQSASYRNIFYKVSGPRQSSGIKYLRSKFTIFSGYSQKTNISKYNIQYIRKIWILILRLSEVFPRPWFEMLSELKTIIGKSFDKWHLSPTIWSKIFILRPVFDLCGYFRFRLSNRPVMDRPDSVPRSITLTFKGKYSDQPMTMPFEAVWILIWNLFNSQLLEMSDIGHVT